MRQKNQFTDEEDDVYNDQVEREVMDLKADMDAAIHYIENEDNIRALYTLDIIPVTDPLKLPRFSGIEGEDFHQFREEMVCTADQLLKLCECLSESALAFVPKSTVPTINKAWTVIKKSYGDAYRIIK